SYRERTSRFLPTLEHVVNTAASTHSREPAREFFSERDKVERLVDRLGFGIDAQGPASKVELSLVHDHVLANPSRTRAGTTHTRLGHRVFRNSCFTHLLSVCINISMRLYAPS